MSNRELSNSQGGYRDTLKDDESLAHFLSALKEFDRLFCNAMMEGVDFTLKLEVHGNKMELIHARVIGDTFRRPSGVERRIDKRQAAG